MSTNEDNNLQQSRILRDIGYEVEFSYAGFEYRLRKESATRWRADPLPEQHEAAAKQKHREAAIECYQREYGEG